MGNVSAAGGSMGAGSVLWRKKGRVYFTAPSVTELAERKSRLRHFASLGLVSLSANEEAALFAASASYPACWEDQTENCT